jgi:hypothetical protein
MKHSASTYYNGKSVTIAKGDTLTIALPYMPVGTEWSFGDNFSFNPVLAMGTSQAKEGLYTVEFTARQAGTVEISMTESWVLSVQGPSNVKGTFKLTVKVVEPEAVSSEK